MKKIKLVVVVGPTASGKSDLAIRLAKKVGGEIISADSRQVYKGMDIGTGKVTKEEQGLVKHWLLDVANPKRQFTVAHYKKLVQKAIRNISRRGKIPIIVGGTGLYIDTLIYNFNLPEIKPNLKLRAKLEKQSAEQLFGQLKSLDPGRAKTIDRHNKRRLVRALEIVLATGQPVPNLVVKENYNTLWLGINPGQEKLIPRISKRLDARLKQGMIKEIEKLHRHSVSWQRLEKFGLEYRWIGRYLQNKISKKEMRDQLLRDIIRYSKRQMTWFKRNKNIHWINSPMDAIKLARKFLLP